MTSSCELVDHHVYLTLMNSGFIWLLWIFDRIWKIVHCSKGLKLMWLTSSAFTMAEGRYIIKVIIMRYSIQLYKVRFKRFNHRYFENFSAIELLFFQQPTNIRFLQFISHNWVPQGAIINLLPITLFQQTTIFAFCNLSYMMEFYEVHLGILFQLYYFYLFSSII